MAPAGAKAGRPARPATATPAAADLLSWAAIGLLGLAAASAPALAAPGRLGLAPALALSASAVLGLVGVALARLRAERRRLLEPIRGLAARVSTLADDPSGVLEPPDEPELRDLSRALDSLRLRIEVGSPIHADDWRMTGSGMFEPPEEASDPGIDLSASGDFAVNDKVNRLEPRGLRWLESSPAEQEFLGWSLAELRQKSFLEVIHPDDRSLAWEQLHAALGRGEAHGLIFRIRTACGEAKTIEVNVGVRYGADRTITHLRCHITDVTAKVRADRELRRRTRELTLVNQQLRRTNRELQELKDRYSDLYQNAPAMYFSLDERGSILECNNTLLRALGYRRDELIGRPYTTLLAESRRDQFPGHFDEFLRTGHIEVESRWKKAGGDHLDVWVTGTAVLGPDGKIRHSRSVAQDVTTRRALEAELKEKNERLARTNSELSRRNKELDDFTYVVSHDLQEPLRTLIAFSDFLMKDCGDRLDDEGKEFVRHLVDASRRMRALITDLLNLSHAGRVTDDFARVNLDEVLGVVKADLSELIRSKGAEVRVAGPLPMLWGDRDRIAQLLGNLIGNGLKYNRSARPVVEIGTTPSDRAAWAVLFVRDNGIGIEPEFHAKIFQIFRRLHAREEYEGTGAGLAICQKIVHAHGGRIWVESEAGRGATFFVGLPRLQDESPILRTEWLHAP